MIEQVTVRNFKSIASATVELCPVTVLIGRSGTGKSNFLNAIAFLRDYLRYHNKALDERGGWARLRPAASETGEFGIDIRFRLEGYDDPFAYALAIKFGKGGQHPELSHESLHLGSLVVFDRSSREWVRPPGVVDQPGLGSLPVLGQLPTLSEAVLAFTALTTGIGMYDFPASVMTNGNAARQSSEGLGGLADDAGNYLRVFQAITRDLRDQRARRTIIARLQQLNPHIKAAELDDISNPHRIVVGHEFGAKRIGLDLSQESDGFRRFYAHLLAMYQSPPKQTLMFEEPENGIYPGALSVLAEEFRTCPRAGRGQIILTTHSPTLLNHFDLDSFRVVEMDSESQATRIAILAQDQRESLEEQLLEPGELLTTDEARASTNHSVKADDPT